MLNQRGWRAKDQSAGSVPLPPGEAVHGVEDSRCQCQERVGQPEWGMRVSALAGPVGFLLGGALVLTSCA